MQRYGAIFTLIIASGILGTGALEAQVLGEGLIIRIDEGLAYIDLGARNGVVEGDIFDILDSEVLTHPLSGDTLGVAPTGVGVLQVRQVFERLALAQVVQLAEGENPMLMPVARIKDPTRRVELEAYVMEQQRSLAGDYGPGLRLALVPGLYQINQDRASQGWAILGLEAAALLAGMAYRSNSNDWYDTYQNLPAGLTERDYAFYYDGAAERRTKSNRFFWLAGAVYAYNWIDVLWRGADGAYAKVEAPAKWRLGMGIDRDGGALLKLVGRF